MTRTRQVTGLIFWLAAALAAGLVGSQFLPGAWYADLVKPSWNPPNTIFAPVWTLLYLMMGTAAWLVWREAGFARARGALALFFLQLVLNALWSYLFFGAHVMGWALLEIGLLWLAIVATAVAFRRHVPGAGLLLVPYAAWVAFAAVLNFTLWHLNR